MSSKLLCLGSDRSADTRERNDTGKWEWAIRTPGATVTCSAITPEARGGCSRELVVTDKGKTPKHYVTRERWS